MEKNRFNRFGIMLDMSRNAVMKPEMVKKYIDILSITGYNSLMLYTEDTYEIEGEPYFGYNRGKYTIDELKDIDRYALGKGIELIPCIQTLAHLNTIFHWPCYDKIKDCNDILLAGNDETYKLIDRMFCSISKSYSSRVVNIGMDEAHMLGRGKYQDLHGCIDRFDILLTHLNKVSEIAKKYDLQLIMWGDMFFRLINQSSIGGYAGEDVNTEIPIEISKMIPDNVNLIYWDYYSLSQENYSKKIKAHSKIKNNIWFAGGLWNWIGFAPHNDYTLRASTAALNACVQNGVKDIFFTVWGDDGAESSRFSILPSLFYVSQISKGIKDIEQIKENFKSTFRIDFDDFMLLDLLETPNKNEDIVGCEKYFLYNDCFMGICDTLANEKFSDMYNKMAAKLHEKSKNNEYGLIFESLACLCDVLAIKCTLGKRTRNAYKNGDKEVLKLIVKDYDKTIILLEKFYIAYEKMWMWENKPHGFDIQDIRIGGLLQRLKHCRMVLNRFINGEILKIDELENMPLDALCRESKTSELINYNMWGKIVSSNVICF